MSVVEFPTPPEEVNDAAEFGACPKCHGSDGLLNVGPEHWFVCHKHKTCWYLGRNLFSNWLYEAETDHWKNGELLKTYHTVEPWYPPKQD